VHTFNSSTLEEEAERLRVWGQPDLKTVSLLRPCLKKSKKQQQQQKSQRRWLVPIILATQEAEIRRIEVWSQARQIVCKTLSWKTHHKKRSWVQAPVLQKKSAGTDVFMDEFYQTFKYKITWKHEFGINFQKTKGNIFPAQFTRPALFWYQCQTRTVQKKEDKL
jgi:hypothetical protein